MTQTETEPRPTREAVNLFLSNMTDNDVEALWNENEAQESWDQVPHDDDDNYDDYDVEYAFPIDEFEQSSPFYKKKLIVSLLNTGCFDSRPDLRAYAVVIATRDETTNSFVNHFYRLYLNHLSGEGGDYVETHNIPSPEFVVVDYGIENQLPVIVSHKQEEQEKARKTAASELQQRLIAQNNEKIKKLVSGFR